MVSETIGCSEPPPRTLGDRGIAIHSSSLARRFVRKIRCAVAADASRDSTYRRHLLSEKLDGCHARRSQHPHRGRDRPQFSFFTERLSDPSAPHHPSIRRRTLSSCRDRRRIAGSLETHPETVLLDN